MSCIRLSIRRYSNLVAVDEGVGFACPFHLADAQHSSGTWFYTRDPIRPVNRNHHTSQHARGNERTRNQDPRRYHENRTFNGASPCKTSEARRHQEEDTRQSKARRGGSFHRSFTSVEPGPIEVGELPASPSPSGSSTTTHRNRMDAV